ncbi:AMP-binding protein [Roseicyclus mahoneyensis]|uniref:Acyl-CoA synthetase (AMP-forming)/AMP-acid ligase II n=1 Tax=Roseicyclus mahoneyensis TaxID=164332 RepID=A0A316H3M0_9RHOB|nr:AMP-binding protein [Roseicyclus mahoneyensis]PWK62113.1 acyl-CoA synthetase (AMP-forming)/AMP-acid ligase II [Roseicyclus mahoneyensis]
MSDLLRDFAAAVARHPDRTALVEASGNAISFADLQTRSHAFVSSWAARGIAPGDRVLLAMPVGADLYAALAAVWSLGATVVLPEPAMGLRGLIHAARTTRPRAFCSAGAYGLLQLALPALWPMIHLRPSTGGGANLGRPLPGPDDIALISFTSGTTGAPKAIPRSHAFLAAQHHAIAPLLDSATEERDLTAFPVFVLINIASGRTSVLPDWKMSRLAHLSPDRLAARIATQNVTRALLPPALCETLARAPATPMLHTVFTGGGPVFPDLLDRLWSNRPGLRIACVYGSTEAEPIAHLEAAAITARDRAAMDAGAGLLAGHPVPGIDLRLQHGEILVAGAHVNAGYLDPAHDAENKIREDGRIWHRTGDAGRLDGAGRLWLLGRAGAEVRTDAATLHPFAVEVAARTWPGVRQAALMPGKGSPCLVIEGTASHLQDWQARARALGIVRVTAIRRMPMDRRHASKIDRAALARRDLG